MILDISFAGTRVSIDIYSSNFPLAFSLFSSFFSSFFLSKPLQLFRNESG